MSKTSLRNLETFGDVAAEDDSVLDYFFSTDAVERVESGSTMLVLGRKGSGKTALVRHFTEGKNSKCSRSESLKGYPWRVHKERIDRGASQMESYVASWRYLIATEMASLALSNVPNYDYEPANNLKTFLDLNYGGIRPSLGMILRPSKLSLSGITIEPTVLGNKLGGISLSRDIGDKNLGYELNSLADSIIKSVHETCEHWNIDRLDLHFDELDQGIIELDSSRSMMIVGLVLAARQIRSMNKGKKSKLSTFVYLRTDFWDELNFSDKNKISETITLNLEWNTDTLLELVNVRVRKKLGDGITWNMIIDDALMRGAQAKWNHIVSRTFLRPRDVIRFLNSALHEAKKSPVEPLVFANNHIVDARESYSGYLKRELDDEIIAHWKEWEEALQSCSAISTLTFGKEEFTREYNKRRSTMNPFDANDALKAMYEFSVIGYERRSGYGGVSWAFDYTDPEAGWNASATRFKVHVGLKEYAKLREERS